MYGNKDDKLSTLPVMLLRQAGNYLSLKKGGAGGGIQE
jgi:hypothetical protein